MTQFRCGHERFINVIENEDRPYLYDVGGEQKETVPMTKELRQWLQSFISIGGRGLNTFSEIRELTKHYAGQIMICFENNAIYQYQSVTTEDNGLTCLKPDNVDSLMNGRWILKTYLTDTAYNIWSVLKYDGDVVENVTLYVDNINGTDEVINDGTELLPFKTIQYAIDTYVYSRGYWKGTLTIRLIEDYADILSLVGLIGNGSLVIQSNDLIRKNVSVDDSITIKNNQIRIGLSNLEATSMSVQDSDVVFTNVITGDGIALNSKLNINSSVFILDVNYCDIFVNTAQVTSVINHSNLIAESLQAGSSISITNSVITSDTYAYIAVGSNCNHNNKELDIIAPIIEYVSYSTPNISVKGYAYLSSEAITERGFVYAKTQNPTVLNDKIIDGFIGSGVYTASVPRYNGAVTTYIKPYIITDSGTFYGNQISHLNTD